MIELSLILPVHNEEEGIEKFVKNVYTLLSKQKFSNEVICVENGSTDTSLKILKKLEKRYKNMTVIESKIGWGNAVRAGIKKAKGKYTCFMVSDGQINPKAIVKVYKKIKNNNFDLVKIRRVSRENVKRLLNSKAYNFLSRLLLGIRSNDINATPKIAKTELLRKMKLKSKNIVLDLEIMNYLKKTNLSFAEIPVRSDKRAHGKSTINVNSMVEMANGIVKILVDKSLLI